MTAQWAAFLNKMPPPPDNFYVVGAVTVGNPGVRPVLTAAEDALGPDGTLQLDLHLVQEPGMWPMVITTKDVRYDRVVLPGAPEIKAIRIIGNGRQIAFIDNVQVVV
ncbi:hypothetical protein [Salinarimonas ramus]|uniref:Uncharacterized protein n=1 Tax=Salinarimonas ramus TaxID=690164 RepID=A0A917Q6W8_9HYPH|nr:hypothetical protein [Salinarimonas ramus]GGK29679.1 hypothetical protein GCM10011322_15120 [Salinarimonas ramus]